MLRRKTSRTKQARELVRLFAVLDAAGSDRRVLPRAHHPSRAAVNAATLRAG
jgi:hypothetical protein